MWFCLFLFLVLVDCVCCLLVLVFIFACLYLCLLFFFVLYLAVLLFVLAVCGCDCYLRFCSAPDCAYGSRLLVLYVCDVCVYCSLLVLVCICACCLSCTCLLLVFVLWSCLCLLFVVVIATWAFVLLLIVLSACACFYFMCVMLVFTARCLCLLYVFAVCTCVYWHGLRLRCSPVLCSLRVLWSCLCFLLAIDCYLRLCCTPSRACFSLCGCGCGCTPACDDFSRLCLRVLACRPDCDCCLCLCLLLDCWYLILALVFVISLCRRVPMCTRGMLLVSSQPRTIVTVMVRTWSTGSWRNTLDDIENWEIILYYNVWYRYEQRICK